jgi:hypothetical protein
VARVADRSTLRNVRFGRTALTAYRIILIAHLFGLAFGLGGASTIDSILLVACRRGKVTRELVDVVHSAAGLVAGAMVLLAVSGTAFFLVGSEPTPKFWAKMVIVAIACLNGLAAHRLVFPLIESAATSGTGRLHLRPWSARLAAASAAVSSVSWSGALILGAWRGLRLGMVPILAVYASVLAAAVLVSAILIAPRVFVFAPAGFRRRQAISFREIPAAAAFAITLAIADAALAIATRLRRRSSWAEAGGVEGFTTPANATWPDWLTATGALDWPRNDGVPPDGRRFREHVGSNAQYRRPTSRGWPNYSIDAESETAGH